MKKTIIVLPLLFTCVFSGYSQTPTQNIRGTVIDAHTRETLPGANIILPGQNTGTITDLDGAFILESIPVGRCH